jgi:hypothetical protein
MTDQHRASPADWLLHAASLDDADSSCILELRARIEALESAQLEQAESNRFCTDAIVRRVEALEAPMTELHAASAGARPAELVERVAETMATPSLPAREWRDESCAVIRAVAAWLRKQGGYPNEWTAQMLEKEADRG